MDRTYELTVIFSPELSTDKEKKAVKALKALVEKVKGKVVKTDRWGKKELAYPISKHKEGIYFQLVVKLPRKGIGPLDESLRRDEAILRHLLIGRAEKTEAKSAKKANKRRPAKKKA
jgi:small subunit ribosomal protein S6